LLFTVTSTALPREFYLLKLTQPLTVSYSDQPCDCTTTMLLYGGVGGGGAQPLPGHSSTAPIVRFSSSSKETVFSCIRQWELYRAPILGRNPDLREEFSSLLFTVTSTALPREFYFFKFTQPLTFSYSDQPGDCTTTILLYSGGGGGGAQPQ
jgi:hypothetical protein